MKKLKISSKKTNDYWELPVLYEDDQVLVVDKPGGVLVRQDGDDPQAPCLNLLFVDHIQRKVAWTQEYGLPFLKATHDLDLEASGALILAKNEMVHARIHEQFYSHKFIVEYVILVQGTPMEEEFSVDIPVGPHGKRPGVYCASQNKGKKSASHFKVLEHFAGFTMLTCQCSPNRLHQARVHMRYLGPPLVGDTVYNGAPLLLSNLKPNYRLKRNKVEYPLMGRPAIHCHKVRFTNPVNHSEIEVDSKLPKDFEVSLKYLRQYADPAGYEVPEPYQNSLDDYGVDEESQP